MKSDAIIGAVQGVTKKWAKQRKREEREASAAANRHHVLTRIYHVSIKDAAWDVMEQAYKKASDNGRLPAHARQIMYAARPHIQQTADRPIGKGFDQYFTQTLLPDYMDHYRVDWNVVFDARGHFQEPHTELRFGLGTLEVREHVRKACARDRVDEPKFQVWEKHYPTLGPRNRYGAILFIEKEGFMPLFKEVRLAERYDLAVMSTKGMSVTASRLLVDEICSHYDIPLLVLHDFDKAGFSIVGTLRRDTRRYAFRNEINVIDLGIHLEDIDGLETEDVYVDSAFKWRANLRQNGATDDEIEFLLGQRVELNAFTSNDLVTWIEGKLKAVGVKKVVPCDDTLNTAYQRAIKRAAVNQRIQVVVDNFEENEEAIKPPIDLRQLLESRLAEDTARSWDSVLRSIAEERFDASESSDG